MAQENCASPFGPSPGLPGPYRGLSGPDRVSGTRQSARDQAGTAYRDNAVPVGQIHLPLIEP